MRPSFRSRGPAPAAAGAESLSAARLGRQAAANDGDGFERMLLQRLRAYQASRPRPRPRPRPRGTPPRGSRAGRGLCGRRGPSGPNSVRTEAAKLCTDSGQEAEMCGRDPLKTALVAATVCCRSHTSFNAHATLRYLRRWRSGMCIKIYATSEMPENSQ